MGRQVKIEFDPDGHGRWPYVASLVLPNGKGLTVADQTEEDAVKKLRLYYEEWLWIREQEPLYPKTVEVDW